MKIREKKKATLQVLKGPVTTKVLQPTRELHQKYVREEQDYPHPLQFEQKPLYQNYLPVRDNRIIQKKYEPTTTKATTTKTSKLVDKKNLQTPSTYKNGFTKKSKVVYVSDDESESSSDCDCDCTDEIPNLSSFKPPPYVPLRRSTKQYSKTYERTLNTYNRQVYFSSSSESEQSTYVTREYVRCPEVEILPVERVYIQDYYDQMNHPHREPFYNSQPEFRPPDRYYMPPDRHYMPPQSSQIHPPQRIIEPPLNRTPIIQQNPISSTQHQQLPNYQPTMRSPPPPPPPPPRPQQPPRSQQPIQHKPPIQNVPKKDNKKVIQQAPNRPAPPVDRPYFYEPERKRYETPPIVHPQQLRRPKDKVKQYIPQKPLYRKPKERQRKPKPLPPIEEQSWLPEQSRPRRDVPYQKRESSQDQSSSSSSSCEDICACISDCDC